MRWNSWRVLAWFCLKGMAFSLKKGDFFIFFNAMPLLGLHAKDDFASTWFHSKLPQLPSYGSCCLDAPPHPPNLSQNGSRPCWQRMLIADNGLFDLMANKTPTDVLDWGGPCAGERKHVSVGLYEVICGSADVMMKENMSSNRGNLIPRGTGNSQHYKGFAA